MYQSKSCRRNKNLLNWILIISTIVIIFICAFNLTKDNFKINFTIVLPIFYVFCFAFCWPKVNLKTPGMLVTTIVTYMRYVITPLVIIASNSFSKITSGLDYYVQAIFIMCYEMLALFITVKLYNPRPGKPQETFVCNKSIVKIITIIAIVLLFINNRSFIGNLSLSSGLANISSDELNETSGIVTILWQALWAFLFCFTIWGINKNVNGKARIYLSILCTLIYIFVIYTGQATISRWYTIVTFIAAICLLCKLYSKDKHRILIITGIPVVVMLLIASIIKNSTVSLNSDLFSSIVSLFNSTNMDTYFAGPVSVNNAIKVYETGGANISSIFYDLLNNFPLLNHYINRDLASANIYNQYLGRGDQIIPLVGQSFIWFSYVFSPLLTIFSVIITKKMDKKFGEIGGIRTYMFAFIAVWTALMPILNITIWVSWIYSRIIPMIILFLIVSKKSTFNKTENYQGICCLR